MVERARRVTVRLRWALWVACGDTRLQMTSVCPVTAAMTTKTTTSKSTSTTSLWTSHRLTFRSSTRSVHPLIRQMALRTRTRGCCRRWRTVRAGVHGRRATRLSTRHSTRSTRRWTRSASTRHPTISHLTTRRSTAAETLSWIPCCPLATPTGSDRAATRRVPPDLCRPMTDRLTAPTRRNDWTPSSRWRSPTGCRRSWGRQRSACHAGTTAVRGAARHTTRLTTSYRPASTSRPRRRARKTQTSTWRSTSTSRASAFCWQACRVSHACHSHSPQTILTCLIRFSH